MSRPQRKKKLTPASLLPEVIETVLALEKRLEVTEADGLKTAGILLGLETRMAAAEEKAVSLFEVTGKTTELLTSLTERVNDLADTVSTLNDSVKRNADSIGVKRQQWYGTLSHSTGLKKQKRPKLY